MQMQSWTASAALAWRHIASHRAELGMLSGASRAQVQIGGPQLPLLAPIRRRPGQQS
jgi:hypothetical protein